MATPTQASQTGRPRVHPWRWIGAFVCAVLIYFILLAVIGSLVNR